MLKNYIETRHWYLWQINIISKKNTNKKNSSNKNNNNNDNNKKIIKIDKLVSQL